MTNQTNLTYKTTDGTDVNDFFGVSIDTTLTTNEWQLLDQALNRVSDRDGHVISDKEGNEYEIDEDEYMKLWSSLYSKLNEFDPTP